MNTINTDILNMRDGKKPIEYKSKPWFSITCSPSGDITAELKTALLDTFDKYGVILCDTYEQSIDRLTDAMRNVHSIFMKHTIDDATVIFTVTSHDDFSEYSLFHVLIYTE